MITAWRITKARWAGQAFDGEGAARFGGRWNSPGSRIVYTSSSISLCVLEMLVHLQSSGALNGYAVLSLQLEEGMVRSLDRSVLPPDWQRYPSPPELAAVGDAWIRNSESVALEVPSVKVPRESNYLINPAHRDFAKCQIDGPYPYDFDARLL